LAGIARVDVATAAAGGGHADPAAADGRADLVAIGGRANLAAIADALVAELADVNFGPPVTHVYNPLIYARAPHAAYLTRYGAGPKEVLLVGMNPGPWGMAQTGVPFGEVSLVRDWMGIDGAVGHPPNEHPTRPVTGFACRRSEVSGRRLWGWARDTFGTPEAFFARFLVINYCPLLFLEESGRNRTPDHLPRAEQAPLFVACDRALRRTIEQLRPRLVVGVGRFAEARARAAAGVLAVEVGRITHPSPANPAANRGWEQLVRGELAALGVDL
jgi:single-strand selective monofunctional uracil DNA glycosylase